MSEKITIKRIAEDAVKKAEKELESIRVLSASKTIGKGLADLKLCRAELGLKSAKKVLAEILKGGEQ